MRLYPFVLSLAACSGGGGSSTDAALDGLPDGAVVHVDDGTPTRVACTSAFGNALTATPTYGRLDGYLVSIVAPSNSSACNADSDHVHLQIKMNNAVYDIAVDVTNGTTHVDDVHSLARDMNSPVNLAWAEGWHTGLSVDYTQPSLAIHAPDVPLKTKAALTSELMTDLATANHISVYAITYGSDGAHLVHRNSGGHDGLIVTEPLSTPSHLRFFSFSDQGF